MVLILRFWEYGVRHTPLSYLAHQLTALTRKVMVARFKHKGITDSFINRLIMAVISGRCSSIHFFKSQVGI